MIAHILKSVQCPSVFDKTLRICGKLAAPNLIKHNHTIYIEYEKMSYVLHEEHVWKDARPDRLTDLTR